MVITKRTRPCARATVPDYVYTSTCALYTDRHPRGTRNQDTPTTTQVVGEEGGKGGL